MNRRVVFAVPGSLGDVHPYLAVGQELRKRGVDVLFCTHPVHNTTVEDSGLRFAPILPNWDWNNAAFVARVMAPKTGTRFLLEAAAYSSMGQYHSLRPYLQHADLVVVHGLAFGAEIAAEEADVPVVAGILAPISLMSTDDPPLPPDIPWFRWLRTLHPHFVRETIRVGKQRTLRWLGPVRRFRQQMGLPDRGHPLFEGRFQNRLVLGLYPEAFAPRTADTPARLVLTGFPCCHPESLQGPTAAAVQAWTEEVSEGPRPVVVTLGTSASQIAPELHTRLVQAAALLGRRVLVLIPDPEQLGLYPPEHPNLNVLPYTPHRLILPHAGVVVHHGGIGTTAEALRAGIPQLVLPFAHDQPDNAARLKHLGVAHVLRPQSAQLERLVPRLSALLSEPRFRHNAIRLQTKLAATDGAVLACEALLRTMEARPRIIRMDQAA